MIRHGEAPYLECSSAGDKRFSAFHAIVPGTLYTIEQIYQGSKILEDGRTNLSIKEAKGKKAVNQEELREMYSLLWDIYIIVNTELQEVLMNAKGLSDMYGQPGHVCQATELWRIREELLRKDLFKTFS